MKRIGVIVWLFLLVSADVAAEEVAQPAGVVDDEVGDEASDEQPEGTPLAAARRRHLVEPLGLAPSPWIALAGVIDGGVDVEGEAGWTALRVHVPVAAEYGAVDARLVGHFDREGLISFGPELGLRAVPLQLADGRGVLGVSFTLLPLMSGLDPVMHLGGGLMGGYLGERWFSWAHVGVRGEVLQRGRPELRATAGGGLRLPHGLRPQVELEYRHVLHRNGEPSLAVRPGFRWWPTEYLGIGVSADVWVVGEELERSSLRLDIVGHSFR